MGRHTWLEFRAIAYPPEAAEKESQRDFIYRAHRSVGLRLAFLFYQLGFTGNLVSVLRMVMSVVGAILMLRLPAGELWLSFFGATLIYGQVILDFSDGALGRLTPGTPELLGFQFDILGCDVGRIAMLAIVGSYAGSMGAMLLAVGSAYVLATFRNAISSMAPRTAAFDALKWVTRWLTSDQFMVVLLPFIVIGVRILSESLLMQFAIVLVTANTILAMAWTLGMAPVRRGDETMSG